MINRNEVNERNFQNDIEVLASVWNDLTNIDKLVDVWGKLTQDTQDIIAEGIAGVKGKELIHSLFKRMIEENTVDKETKSFEISEEEIQEINNISDKLNKSFAVFKAFINMKKLEEDEQLTPIKDDEKVFTKDQTEELTKFADEGRPLTDNSNSNESNFKMTLGCKGKIIKIRCKNCGKELYNIYFDRNNSDKESLLPQYNKNNESMEFEDSFVLADKKCDSCGSNLFNVKAKIYTTLETEN